MVSHLRQSENGGVQENEEQLQIRWRARVLEKKRIKKKNLTL